MSAKAEGQVKMSSRSSRAGRPGAAGQIGNVIQEQQDTPKCRPGAKRYVEMSSWSSRTCRHIVLEQQDTSKCRPEAAGQVEVAGPKGQTKTESTG